MNPLRFFVDPILRGPTNASMLMCLVAAVVGVLIFVKRRSLLGEALAHAAYPGVAGAIIFVGFFSCENALSWLMPLGSLLSAIAGFWLVNILEKKLNVTPDAALGCTLALFFGVGVTIASFAQSSYTHLYRQMQNCLYGQAATMTDVHIAIYGALALIVIIFVALFYKQIMIVLFDAEYAKISGIPQGALNFGIFLIVALAIVIGVRCVGVVLMSAMLIAPAAAARQFTNRLPKMLLLAAIFGVLSAFWGVYGSLLLSEKIQGHYFVPTGPMIVVVSGLLALYALFFAPRRGLVNRYMRVLQFRRSCARENLLKALWRLNQQGQTEVTFADMKEKSGYSSFYLYTLVSNLVRQTELTQTTHKARYYQLTSRGFKKGARIIRLHRLWEVYLVNSLGLKVERVHKSAEEMEHILTPELENRLTELLNNPTQDPHDRPIPKQEAVGDVF